MGERIHQKSKGGQQVGLVTYRVSSVPNKAWAADVLWRMEIKPGLLYGAEVISYGVAWTKELERMQSKVGRWILGLTRSASATGTRGEMGWPKMANEIKKRKLTMWGRLIHMDRDRWAKIPFEEMRVGAFKSEWLKEAQEAVEELGGMSWQGNWKGRLKKKWWDIQEREWQAERLTKQRLRYRPKIQLQGRAEHIEKTMKGQLMSKYRLGDVESYKEEVKCHNCGLEGNPARHIILECKHLDRMREAVGWSALIKCRQEEGQGEEATILEILGDRLNATKLKKMHDAWKIGKEG